MIGRALKEEDNLTSNFDAMSMSGPAFSRKLLVFGSDSQVLMVMWCPFCFVPVIPKLRLCTSALEPWKLQVAFCTMFKLLFSAALAPARSAGRA